MPIWTRWDEAGRPDQSYGNWVEHQLIAAESRIGVLEAALRRARYHLAMVGLDESAYEIDAALATQGKQDEKG